jgi:quercetin dioxygenase-like cupin family protein
MRRSTNYATVPGSLSWKCSEVPAALYPALQDRRSFLFSAAAARLSAVWNGFAIEDRHPGTTAFVAGPLAGEHLLHFRDGGDIFIDAGLANGSANLAMGTQQVLPGTGIPTHRHFTMDEAFVVLKGSGTVTLEEQRQSIAPGATIFIPKSTWHSFENPDGELLVLWIVTPAGLDGFFRDTCSPPGAPGKNLAREQIREIALKKYHTEFR